MILTVVFPGAAVGPIQGAEAQVVVEATIEVEAGASLQRQRILDVLLLDLNQNLPLRAPVQCLKKDLCQDHVQDPDPSHRLLPVTRE